MIEAHERFPELRCYCDDPVYGHRVNPEADCHCDGVCRDDCACHDPDQEEWDESGDLIDNEFWPEGGRG